MMRSFVFALSLALSPMAFAEQPDFVPGRPGEAETAISVPEGHLQIETEIASYTHDEEDRDETSGVSVAATTLRYGLAHGLDAELIVQPYLRAREESGGVKQTDNGFGDVTLRLRRTIVGQDGDGPSIGIIGFVTLPTAEDGLGADDVEGGAILAGAFDLSDKWNLAWTIGAAAVSTEDDYEGEYSGAVTLGYALNDKWGAYGELAASKAERDDETAATFDVGATYLLNPVTQLDAGANFGITDAADDLSAFIGWARRF
jgi:hypothetical protein